MVKPKGTFYAFVEIENHTHKKWKSDWAFVRALLHEGVVVVPGTGFTSTMPDRMFFRVVFLPSLQRLGEALDRIEAFMKKH